MCLIFVGYMPDGDIEALRRLGEDWNREIRFVPIFHPDHADEMESAGYAGKPVKVKVRVEIEKEEAADA